MNHIPSKLYTNHHKIKITRERERPEASSLAGTPGSDPMLLRRTPGFDLKEEEEVEEKEEEEGEDLGFELIERGLSSFKAPF